MPMGIGGAVIEQISYDPGLPTSGDLEAATPSITATAEPGAADYSWTGGPVAPSDTRLALSRLSVRLQVTIDSFAGGGAVLNYRIKRGGTSIGTGTLSTGASTGAKYVAHDVTTGTLTGDALLEVFLWVDVGSCVVSVCTLWSTAGSSSNGNPATVLTLTYDGLVSIAASLGRLGSATIALRIMRDPSTWDYYAQGTGGDGTVGSFTLVVKGTILVTGHVNAANEVAYLRQSNFTLMSG